MALTTLVCDGSYEGLLSALFEAHRLRPWPEQVLLKMPEQQSLWDTPVEIATNLAHAQRLQRAIDTKLSAESAEHVRMVHACAQKDAGTLLLKYLRLGWQVGHKLDHYMAHPCVQPVHILSRKVSFEVHRMEGLVRFTATPNQILYAKLEPDYNIVPFLAQHFAQRLPQENWILHDLRHEVAAFHKPGETKVMPLTGKAPDLDFNDPYERLWQAFYDAIGIKERTNPNLRRSFMPTRYHKHLPEINRQR